jgi:hypothetical protein
MRRKDVYRVYYYTCQGERDFGVLPQDITSTRLVKIYKRFLQQRLAGEVSGLSVWELTKQGNAKGCILRVGDFTSLELVPNPEFLKELDNYGRRRVRRGNS